MSIRLERLLESTLEICAKAVNQALVRVPQPAERVDFCLKLSQEVAALAIQCTAEAVRTSEALRTAEALRAGEAARKAVVGLTAEVARAAVVGTAGEESGQQTEAGGT